MSITANATACNSATEDWYAPLRQVRSLGSTTARPGSLAGLHEARKVNLAQFFTPDDLARLMWEIGCAHFFEDDLRTLSILDNSIGSGRLIQFAMPGQTIGGIDVHEDSLAVLARALKDGGFEDVMLSASGLQECAARGFDLALINPPFSIQLSSPTLTPYSTNTYGPYGPHTNAVSHTYALQQAAEAACVVCAVLPRSYTDRLMADVPVELEGRIEAVIDLPAGAFNEEGTAVGTCVVVIGPNGSARQPVRFTVVDLTDIPGIVSRSCAVRGSCNRRSPQLRDRRFDQQQTITLPVTGRKTVRVVHHGRRVVLHFNCGLVQAKVMNAILRAPVRTNDGERRAPGINYCGQGLLDVEAWLASGEPAACFERLLHLIASNGGEADVCRSFLGFLARRIRLYDRQATPFGHWALMEGQAGTSAAPKRKMLLTMKKWGAPVLTPGVEYPIERTSGGDYRLEINGFVGEWLASEIGKHFEIRGGACEKQWQEVYPSKLAKFPEHRKAIEARMRQTGADQVASWGYQFHDVAEAQLGRHALIPWKMGLGKTRLAIALCLMGGKRNGIVVEAHLVDELLTELRGLGVSTSEWQVITAPEHLHTLRRINIISYNRLAMNVAGRGKSTTYAKALRRRLSVVVADEAHLLRNTATAQSRALVTLAPRRRYAITGTPIYGYVQHLLPLTAFVYGDGTALQRYGRYYPEMTPGVVNTLSYVQRGIDAFLDRHAVLEWVTHEWKDGQERGAKRQVPKIANIGDLRDYLAPLMRRRVRQEPDCAPHFKQVKITTEVHEIEWDMGHLSHYLTVAEKFEEWYRDAADKAGGKNVNLVALLARIGAVERAANCPHRPGSDDASVSVPIYAAPTSKQRWVVDRAAKYVAEGHKTIIYTDGPALCDRLASMLEARGIEVVTFHGGKTINARTKELNNRFRNGSAQVLIASKMTVQTGLNLWHASRGIVAARDWSAVVEDQCVGRMDRPQQTRDVHVDYPNLVGSVDDYQHQMVAMKGAGASAALDFTEIAGVADVDFKHMDAMLHEFVEGFAALRGMKGYQLREALVA